MEKIRELKVKLQHAIPLTNPLSKKGTFVKGKVYEAYTLYGFTLKNIQREKLYVIDENGETCLMGWVFLLGKFLNFFTIVYPENFDITNEATVKKMNYEIYAPDGTFLFHCKRRKYNWYVKDKAIEFEPKKAKLTFEPNLKEDFHHNPKHCVNCGTTENLTTHHVVPQKYLPHIPYELKEKLSHQSNVMLCRKCHNKYELIAIKLHNKLIPHRRLYNNDIIYFQKLHCTMQDKGDLIPAHKKSELKGILSSLSEKLGMSYDDIVNTKVECNKRDLVKVFVEEYGAEKLIKLWVQHFYDNMELKHLPDWWRNEK